MRVVCPNCKFDAGEVPSVALGTKVECHCGYKWTYQAAPPPKAAGGDTAAMIGSAAGKALESAGVLAAAGFRKTGSFIAKKWFSRKVPKFFLDAMSDGVVTEEEEQNLRSQLTKHGISWEEAVKEIQPLAKDFVRRVLADIVADEEITTQERLEISRYVRIFNLTELRTEIEQALDRVETIWKLNNGTLPMPLPDKPMWLRSDEKIYFQRDAGYLKPKQNNYETVSGKIYVTTSRCEFISNQITFSHPHEQLRQCEAVRRTHLSLLFHPKRGSGTYILSDAPMAAAYLNVFARTVNRTASISREDSTLGERRRIPQEVKHEVWVRDGGKCVECKAEDYLEFDHIIPVIKGGANTVRNIQLLCRRCNGKKSDKI